MWDDDWRDDDDETSIGDATYLRQTQSAIMVRFKWCRENTWIPKSVLRDSEINDDSYVGQYGDVVVATWWAEKQGLG